MKITLSPESVFYLTACGGYIRIYGIPNILAGTDESVAASFFSKVESELTGSGYASMNMNGSITVNDEIQQLISDAASSKKIISVSLKTGSLRQLQVVCYLVEGNDPVILTRDYPPVDNFTAKCTFERKNISEISTEILELINLPDNIDPTLTETEIENISLIDVTAEKIKNAGITGANAKLFEEALIDGGKALSLSVNDAEGIVSLKTWLIGSEGAGELNVAYHDQTEWIRLTPLSTESIKKQIADTLSAPLGD